MRRSKSREMRESAQICAFSFNAVCCCACFPGGLLGDPLREGTKGCTVVPGACLHRVSFSRARAFRESQALSKSPRCSGKYLPQEREKREREGRMRSVYLREKIVLRQGHLESLWPNHSIDLNFIFCNSDLRFSIRFGLRRVHKTH